MTVWLNGPDKQKKNTKTLQFVEAYHTRLTRHPYLLAYVVSEAARRPDLVKDFYSPERRRAVASSCLFPFAARPMINEVLGRGSNDLAHFMERRRRELPDFVKRALQR